MNLKRDYHYLSKVSFVKVICCFLACTLILSVGISVYAASKHSTRPAISVENGEWNPTKHDQVKCYVDFCTYHNKKPNNSKAIITYEAKSSAKKTKTVSFKYDTAGPGALENAPTYTEYNKGKKQVAKLKTNEADKYTAYGRYKTSDCYCVICQVAEKDGWENYNNLDWCKWKSE